MKQKSANIYYKILSHFPLLISIITVILYYHSLFGEFIIDDVTYLDNTKLTSLNPLDIKAVFVEATNKWGELLPLRDYLYVLEYNTFGKWTTGYHLVSLLLFIASGFMVYYFSKLLFEDRIFKDQAPANKYWPVQLSACIVMSFFLLNPMYVESVAYISGQKDILSVFMILISLVFLYKTGKKSTKPMYWIFGLGILFHYLAVLSKLSALATIIFVPFLWLITSDKNPRHLLKLVGFWLLANIPVFLWVQYILTLPSLGKIFVYTPLFERLMRAINIIGIHLNRITWPNELRFGYEFLWPKANDFHWYTNFNLYSLIGLLFIFVLIFLFFKYRKSYITLGMLFFIIYLAPALSIFPDLPNEKIYDRYLALPLIGIFIVILGLLYLLQKYWPKTKLVLAGCVVFLCVCWYVMTINYIPVYRNDVTVWENNYRLDPNKDFNIHAYIRALILNKKFTQAEFVIKNIDSKVNVNMSDALIEYYLGFNYFAQEKYELAEPLLFSSTIKAYKSGAYPHANYYLAIIYLNKGEVEKAEKLLREQLALPNKVLLDVIKIEKLLEEIQQLKQHQNN
ncbi:tetratricopeptide repeat protein [Aestuariivivens sp. NBU2969]|uniref:tetratricopeptide repeat protein n=1 Tax=Aestuariivivens sp. NBU2969 TaxID=2873267 RepID=UPI001CBEF9D4|nr:tetratricopeptide repeat protein [Aestuariivivens sp. NBU2969]